MNSDITKIFVINGCRVYIFVGILKSIRKIFKKLRIKVMSQTKYYKYPVI